MGKRIILASASPRRHELLKTICEEFECIVSECDESVFEGTTPTNAVMELSRRKAGAVAYKLDRNEESIVIGADTVVCLDGVILGKPANTETAMSMLRRLSGKSHMVYTGVAIYLVKDDKITLEDNFYVSTEVIFNEMSEEEIEDYVRTGEPMDKAGAYGIQGAAARFIKSINGDYYNVVGFPVSAVYGSLKKIL
ncbi:MAG: Maf family protein [Lachnospiraceae bacterium]|nr:Maf family protein [Lachnospiraceae bacterium]